ncbi:Hypothetical predicted protein, partial [Mytilus galloprovincialis]
KHRPRSARRCKIEKMNFESISRLKHKFFFTVCNGRAHPFNNVIVEVKVMLQHCHCVIQKNVLELSLLRIKLKKSRECQDEGYVVIEKFFDIEADLEPCRRAIEDLVEELAQKLFKAGKIKNLYREYGLDKRLIKIDEEWPGAVILLHKIGHLPQAFRNLWGNEKLLNLIEQVLGPEIAGMPNWNFRDKTPHNEATTVPWHQDAGYLSTDVYKVLLATVWIPFLDTNRKNGCMEVIPRGHSTGKVANHTCCAGDTWYIQLDEEDMNKTLGCSSKDKKLCPIPYGGLLLFNNFIPHRSLDNASEGVRWSIDLRFKKPGLPNGMFGLKPDVLLRTKENPNMKIDWDTFDSIDRTKAQIASVRDLVEIAEDQEFDTTVQGPWMRKWELVNHNNHVKKHVEMEAAKNKDKILG